MKIRISLCNYTFSFVYKQIHLIYNRYFFVFSLIKIRTQRYIKFWEIKKDFLGFRVQGKRLRAKAWNRIFY
jgi:hypothetical protein